MAYPWHMRILQRWTQLLLFLTSISNNKKMIGPAPHDIRISNNKKMIGPAPHNIRISNNKKMIGPAPRDIPYLPSDVIINILSWLPAECVLKFRRVCKRWLVLTSSPYFVEMHRKRAVPVLVLQMATQFKSSKQAAYYHDLYIFDDHATDVKLKVPRIGSLKKLKRQQLAILYGSGNGFLVFKIRYLAYLVLNLVTRENVIFRFPQISKGWTGCGIVFHFGIGENMLIFWRKMERRKFSFGIYLFSSKLWRLTSTSSDRPKDRVDPIVFNDRLHWMSVSARCRHSIISCDMNVEGFCSMSHPSRTCDWSHEYMCLLEHEGKLAFGDCRPPSISIWVLEDYNTWSWSLKYNVNLHSDVKCVSRQDLVMDDIGWPEYCRIVNCELIFYWRGVGIVGYHLERKTARMFDAPSYKNKCRISRSHCAVVSYTKCLVPLCSKRVVN